MYKKGERIFRIVFGASQRQNDVDSPEAFFKKKNLQNVWTGEQLKQKRKRKNDPDLSYAVCLVISAQKRRTSFATLQRKLEKKRKTMAPDNK